MIDRIREMNESQASSLAARRLPAHGAVLGAILGAAGLSLALLLAGCGQKGPLFLPAQAGTAAKPAAPAPSATVPAR
jgi:predicted small lipoprotein YifL